MTSPFFLFCVPNLPLGRIIDFIEPDALVSLSFCSQKSHSVIKALRKAPYEGRLLVAGSDEIEQFLALIGECLLMTRNLAYISSFEREEYVKLGEQQVRVKWNCRFLMTYWENPVDGLKVTTDYVTDLFNIDVTEISVSKETFEMIEHVNSRQKTPLTKVSYIDWIWRVGR